MYHIHSLLAGYVFGYPGLLKEPMAPDNSAPQPVKTARLSQFQVRSGQWEEFNNPTNQKVIENAGNYFKRKIIKLQQSYN